MYLVILFLVIMTIAVMVTLKRVNRQDPVRVPVRVSRPRVVRRR